MEKISFPRLPDCYLGSKHKRNAEDYRRLKRLCQRAGTVFCFNESGDLNHMIKFQELDYLAWDIMEAIAFMDGYIKGIEKKKEAPAHAGVAGSDAIHF